MRLAFAAWLGACLLSATAPASAQQGQVPKGYEAVSARVSISGLNLSTPEGERAFEKRVQRAVRRMCGTTATSPEAFDVKEECIALSQPAARRLITATLDKARRNQPSVLVAARSPSEVEAAGPQR